MASRKEQANRALYSLFTVNRAQFDRENGRGASDSVIADKLTRFGQTPTSETDRKIVARASQGNPNRQNNSQPNGGDGSNSPKKE